MPQVNDNRWQKFREWIPTYSNISLRAKFARTQLHSSCCELKSLLINYIYATSRYLDEHLFVVHMCIARQRRGMGKERHLAIKFIYAI